jgi:hypothetical protein
MRYTSTGGLSWLCLCVLSTVVRVGVVGTEEGSAMQGKEISLPAKERARIFISPQPRQRGRARFIRYA